MRPLSPTSVVLLSSLPIAFSQPFNVNLNPDNPVHDPTCHSQALASDHYIYFTSPNDPTFLFSIYTEWEKWYPSILQAALSGKGFKVELRPLIDQKDNCGWKNDAKIQVAGWNRGVISYKEVPVPMVAPKVRPIFQQQAEAQPSPKTNTSAAHFPRLQGSQSAGHPITYWMAHPPAASSSSIPQTSQLMHIPRNAARQPSSSSIRYPVIHIHPSISPLIPLIPPVSRRAAPAVPTPQPQTLAKIRNILLSNSPDADIALFLFQVIAPVLAVVLILFLFLYLGRALVRLLYPAPKLEEEDGIEMSSLSGQSIKTGDPFADPVKTKLVRIVPKGDERVYQARTKVRVPTSSSVYSRDMDGVTLYGEHGNRFQRNSWGY